MSVNSKCGGKIPPEVWTADLASGKIAPKQEGEPYYLWPVLGNRFRWTMLYKWESDASAGV